MPEEHALYEQAVRWHERAIAEVRPAQRARLVQCLKILRDWRSR
jgi:hypothetical protein